MQQAMDDARAAAAKKLGSDADSLDIQTFTDPQLPGLLVFHAVRSDCGRVRHVGGAVVDGEVALDGAQALGNVFAAWNYGPERTRTAEEVARAAVLLVPAEEPSRLISTPTDLASATRLGFPDAAPPTDVDVDGVPGVKFWFKNGYNPVTEVEVAPAAAAGGPATIRIGRTHGGG